MMTDKGVGKVLYIDDAVSMRGLMSDFMYQISQLPLGLDVASFASSQGTRYTLGQNL